MKITKRQLKRIIKEELALVESESLSPLERWSSMADSYGMQIRNRGSDYKMYNTRPDGSQQELELFIKLIRYLYDADGMISTISISKKR